MLAEILAEIEADAVVLVTGRRNADMGSAAYHATSCKVYALKMVALERSRAGACIVVESQATCIAILVRSDVRPTCQERETYY